MVFTEENPGKADPHGANPCCSGSRLVYSLEKLTYLLSLGTSELLVYTAGTKAYTAMDHNTTFWPTADRIYGWSIRL